MSRYFIALIVLALLSLTPQNGQGQATVCSQDSIPIVARDARGELIPGISSADLEVMVNGTPQKIMSIHREKRPRRIVILVDASASMRGIKHEVPWSQAIASAKLLTSLSEGRAQLALLIFNEKVIEEINFEPGNSAVSKRLDELEKDQEFFDHSVKGKTALYDAMWKALELLGQPTSADELYVASDGEDNQSHRKEKELEKKLAEGGVRVFASYLQGPLGSRSRTPEEMNIGRDLTELVERSGGEFIFVSPTGVAFGFDTHPNPSREEGLRMFFEGIFENEVLQVSAANQVSGKRDLKITLSPSERVRLKGAQLFCPRQLPSCPASQSVSSTP
jgi:hypothetical protein